LDEYTENFAVNLIDDPKKREIIKFRDISGTIDWNHIKTWVAFCREHYGYVCRQGGSISRLTAIACETMNIDPLPTEDTPYLTLSYLVSPLSLKIAPITQTLTTHPKQWGSGNLGQGTVNGKLNGAPRIINDAITVVRSLGWRYL
jgi:hypothetical protein